MLKFSEIPTITAGKILQLQQDTVISKLLIDSRQLVVHPQAVFFALMGPRNDGHLYAMNLYQQGIRNFILQKLPDQWPEQTPLANILLVEDSVQALQAIARHHRRQFHLPVLGITGSNAKTVIKEWLYQLLGDKKVVKSPKSYNSQVGVPLSVWQLHEDADLAIFEAGISQVDEMHKLQEVIQPTLGIFTNIGSAHDSGFENKQQKVSEKARLFSNSDLVIYCRDHQLIHNHLNQELDQDHLLAWSDRVSADIQFETTISEDQVKCKWQYGGEDGLLWLPFQDHASLENLKHCIAFLLFQGYAPQKIQSGIDGLAPVQHRLALKKGLHNCYLVDDTYNNDFAGLEIALDFLNQQPHGKEKTLILSDIQQAAESDEILYGMVADLIQLKGIKHLYGIGPSIASHAHLFSKHHRFYQTTEEFLQALPQLQDQLILVKGAREFSFEHVINLLQEKLHRTVLEIDLDALTSNLNSFRRVISGDTKIMVMVKAFAYGSGSQEIAHLLQYQGVDYLGVAYADEGVLLRRDGIHLPIMVMNPTPESFEKLFQHRLEPEIYSLDLLEDFQKVSLLHAQPLPVHLKIDTGMRRLGFEPAQLEALIAQLRNQPTPVASIFSHLAASDDKSENSFSKQQGQQFVTMANAIEQALGTPVIKHLVNSSGITAFPDFHFDMVRLGIGLYGVGSSALKLQSISTLKTTISQIKNVAPGETVGYGRVGVADTPRIIATIAIGYADGFDRRNSNGVGKVLVGSHLAPVMGNVCMDMTMVDITGIPAKVGDTVIIFNAERSIEQLATDIGTIPYEVLTQVSERVRRIYFAQ